MPIDKNILASFDGSSVLVTGGTGLIGRQVVDILADTTARIRVVSLDSCPSCRRGVDYIIGDLTDLCLCKNLMRDTDFVFHLAGVTASVLATENHPASHMVPMLQMNTNVLEAARLSGVKKLVYTSSIGAYASGELLIEGKDDASPAMDQFAGLAKRVAEQQILAYRIQYSMSNFAVVRPGNCFGAGDNFDLRNAMVIPSLMRRIREGHAPVVVWGDGQAVRDFVYSRDVAQGVILALYHGTDSRYINLGSGIGYSIKELVETMRSFIDFRYIFDDTANGTNIKTTGYAKRVLSIRLAQTRLGYCPETSLADGLKKTWEWYMENDSEYHSKKNYFREN